MDRFFAIDVETANPRISSICQIGVVGFECGEEFFARTILVDPEDWFDPMNVSIHGIQECDVRGAPTFADLLEELDQTLQNELVVSHTHFDRSSIIQAAQRYGRNAIGCRWLDSARVARRAWPEFAKSGYGLANLAKHLGISFKHHDAGEDARAAGHILLSAMQISGLSLDQWIEASLRPITPYQSVKRSGDGDGALIGETIVFTGALSIPRKEAADRAAEAGANVVTTVTKLTTMLVVGDQDITKLAGKAKSSKHLKAEAMIESGQPMRIIGESDFLFLSSITE